MPPHCDSLDGPVVSAARQALDAGDVELVLPFVPVEGEAEVRSAFARALPLRAIGPDARELADLYFFETVVRVHRAGEGAPYTGLKPAGMDVGPVIPRAEHAIEDRSSDALADFLCAALRAELGRRMNVITALSEHRERSVVDARHYVEAALDFEVYSHHLYQAMHSAHHHEAAATG